MALNNENDLVCVLRRPDGLFACRVQRAEQFGVLPPSMDKAPGPLGLVDPYVESVVPRRARFLEGVLDAPRGVAGAGSPVSPGLAKGDFGADGLGTSWKRVCLSAAGSIYSI